MKQTLKEELKQHRLLLISVTVSFGLLIVFLTLQHRRAEPAHMLELDIKWLILSGVPILIGLFIGGYIKNFKGFGLELESNLKEPIPLSLITISEFKRSEGMNKESLANLHKLSEIEKNKIDRLRFIYGKSFHYYNIDAVKEHCTFLPKLRFIEIVNDKFEFQYLIPVNAFKVENIFNDDEISKFIKAIEKKNIQEYFPDAITDYILTTNKIIDAYRTFKKSTQTRIISNNKDILPILDDKMKMIGTIDKQKLEAKIAEEVDKNID